MKISTVQIIFLQYRNASPPGVESSVITSLITSDEGSVRAAGNPLICGHTWLYSAMDPCDYMAQAASTIYWILVWLLL